MATLPLRVRIGNWIAAGSDEHLINDEGFILAPDGFKGWDDGVDQRRDMVPRPAAAGSFDTVGYPDSRVVALSGSCWAETPLKLNWFRNQLTGLFQAGNPLPVNVDHQGETLFNTARLASKPIFTVTGADARDATWSLQLWFADPRKFGDKLAYGPGTTVDVWHYGNYPASPILRVAGTIGTGYTIEGPDGKEFTVTTPVTSGHAHTIDMDTGLLWIDGAIVYGEISQGDTWTIPPGETVEMTLDPVTGSGLLDVTVPNTSI